MIELSSIYELIKCPLNQNVETLCHLTFNELPTSYYDDDLDETYLIFKNSGVSILYGAGGNSESIFFHFLGDEDTEKCTLDVLGLKALSLKSDVVRFLESLNASIIKEIDLDERGVSALVFKVDSLVINAEFNDASELILFTFMPDSSYPC